MDLTAVNVPAQVRGLTRISEDEAIFAFLKSSTDSLSGHLRRRLERIPGNSTYEDTLACREICQAVDRLDYFRARHWYRASIDARALRFVRLGSESSNNFSNFFSEGTYLPHVAARNIQTWSGLKETQCVHQDKVMRYAESIEADDLENVILCASNFTVNRRLKTFDGNHRLIAYVVRHGELPPFSCIVGFSKPRYIGLLQRALLRFEFLDEARDAVMFALRQNLRRTRSLLSGGVNYQPLLDDGAAIRRLASCEGDTGAEHAADLGRAERVCADRARILRDDLRETVGALEGRTLLDIGCNVGFFCHYFASLGVQAVGIDNNQHNRNQRYSLSNSVRTAIGMNRRYGLECEFLRVDAREWVKGQTRTFDVVLLLSVLHHFFLGYPLGRSEGDPMAQARNFLGDVARLTREVLYIEYEDHHSEVSTRALEQLLRSTGWFRSVEQVAGANDFERPMIRCTKH